VASNRSLNRFLHSTISALTPGSSSVRGDFGSRRYLRSRGRSKEWAIGGHSCNRRRGSLTAAGSRRGFNFFQCNSVLDWS
jgi:hypothetical protein